MTETHGPLLIYSSDRVARDIARARRAAAQEVHFQRRILRIAGICAAEFMLGYLILMLAFHVSGTELGQGLFALGAFVILAIPLFTVIVWAWSTQQR